MAQPLKATHAFETVDGRRITTSCPHDRAARNIERARERMRFYENFGPDGRRKGAGAETLDL